jgi:CO dehydrogenase maturation factor
MKIAVSGKGGVGKTFIAGTLAWLFAKDGYPVIAIDADSSPGLAMMLGLSEEQAEAVLPISRNRELIDQKTGTGFPGVYSLAFSVDDIIGKYSLPTPAGVNLMVMGTVTSMGSGCACQANTLVRALLRHLVVDRDEVIIIDLEAGVEHLGRGTAENVDIMLVVTDANAKSLQTASKISALSREAGIERVLLVGNMIEDQAQYDVISCYARDHGLRMVSCIPFSREVKENGIRGAPVFHGLKGPVLHAIEKLRSVLCEDTGAGKISGPGE